MLSNQELDRLAAFLVTADSYEIDLTEWNTCIGIVEAELIRRQDGPYTLAEAIRSGRPFTEIDTDGEPVPWIVRRGVGLYILGWDGKATTSQYIPMVREMCEPVFKLMPEEAK